MTLRISRTFGARTEQLILEKLLLEQLRLTYCIPHGKEIETKPSSFGAAMIPSQIQ